MDSPVTLAAGLLDTTRGGAPPAPDALAALANVDPAGLGPPARLAFWLNLYNALVRDGVRGKSGDLRRPHHIDLKSGKYKGRQILPPQVELE